MSQRDNPAGVKIVNISSPAPRDAWEEVLRRAPLALETQSPAWADATCAAGGFEDASRLYETANGRRLVLPLLRRSFAGGGGACGTAGRLVPEFYLRLEQAPAGWAGVQDEACWLAVRRVEHRDPREEFEAMGR